MINQPILSALAYFYPDQVMRLRTKLRLQCEDSRFGLAFLSTKHSMVNFVSCVCFYRLENVSMLLASYILEAYDANTGVVNKR